MIPAIVYAKLHRVPLTTYVLDLWPENLYSVLPVRNRLLRAVAQGVSALAVPPQRQAHRPVGCNGGQAARGGAEA